MMQRLRMFLFGHPLMKALGIGLFGLVGNVLAGAYVFDMTKPIPSVAGAPSTGQFLDWWSSPYSPAAWALLVVLILMGLYGWAMAHFETKIQVALSNAGLRERAYAALLPTMLDAVKKDIEAGNVKTMPEVMAILGIEGGRVE